MQSGMQHPRLRCLGYIALLGYTGQTMLSTCTLLSYCGCNGQEDDSSCSSGAHCSEELLRSSSAGEGRWDFAKILGRDA